MQNYSKKQTAKKSNRDETAAVVAGIFNKTPRLVRMVIQGKVDNPPILEAVITYKEGKSELIKQLEQLVPIN